MYQCQFPAFDIAHSCIRCHHWGSLGEGYMGLCTHFATSCVYIFQAFFFNASDNKLVFLLKLA